MGARTLVFSFDGTGNEPTDTESLTDGQFPANTHPLDIVSGAANQSTGRWPPVGGWRTRAPSRRPTPTQPMVRCTPPDVQFEPMSAGAWAVTPQVSPTRIRAFDRLHDRCFERAFAASAYESSARWPAVCAVCIGQGVAIGIPTAVSIECHRQPVSMARFGGGATNETSASHRRKA